MDVSKFVLSDYASKLSDSDKLKYCEKLASINTQQCPFKINKQYWTETEKDLKCLVKNTTRWDLVLYLIYKESILDGKPIESVKSLDSYKKFAVGYLRDFCGMKLPGGFILVKGLVSVVLFIISPISVKKIIQFHHIS